MALPAFLHPTHISSESSETLSQNCLFKHTNKSLHDVHALWWSPTRGKTPSKVLIFIPGNPGLVHFYRPFLTALYNKSNGELAILAKAQIGHTPGFEAPASSCSLAAQVQSASEVFYAVSSTFGPQASIVLAGHSVGAYICTQLLKLEQAPAIVAVFLLFPTICYIRDTPNGGRLAWLFRSPIPRVISSLTHLARFLPESALRVLFNEWPHAQISILHKFIQSPDCTFAALTMANEEMHTIRDLESESLDSCRDRLWFYFAEQDGWVGPNKDRIISALGSSSTTSRINLGAAGIPHAFCISAVPPTNLVSTCLTTSL
jgi:pimeloyl-ACP methyl ester carboxylesterase